MEKEILSKQKWADKIDDATGKIITGDVKERHIVMRAESIEDMPTLIFELPEGELAAFDLTTGFAESLQTAKRMGMGRFTITSTDDDPDYPEIDVDLAEVLAFIEEGLKA